MQRRRPGVVRDAIMAVMGKAPEDGLPLSEVQAEVEKIIGEAVASSSVRSYLNLNTPELFVRTGHGKYGLRK